ncbi:MAG TPA: DsrE family protein [Candidatus Hypogeohydataceae bacterium YC41]
MTQIAILVHKSPFNTVRNSEGLRMAVGLTLEESNKVTIIFVKDGVYLIGNVAPERIQSGIVKKHLDALRMLGHRLVAERESMEERGIKEPSLRVDVLSRAEVIKLLSEANRVIPWQ